MTICWLVCSWSTNKNFNLRSCLRINFLSKKWLTAKYQFSSLVSRHSKNIPKNNPYEFATDILFPFLVWQRRHFLERNKKGSIFLNSVPIQNVQWFKYNCYVNSSSFLCVTNVFNVLGAVDLFKDFNRKN